MAKGSSKRDDSEAPEYYEQQSEYETDEETESKKSGNGGATAIHGVVVLFLFIAFVFMVFVSASPVTEKFYLFSLKIKVDALINKTSSEVMLGVWGYCTSGIENSTGLGSLSIDAQVTEGGCKERRIGWTFKDIPGIPSSIQDGISAALTSAFALHIISAAAIFLALVVAILSASKREKPTENNQYSTNGDPYNDPNLERGSASRKAFFFVLIALIFTGTVFVLDIVGFVLVKDKLSNKSRGVATLGFGPALGFVVAAFALVLVASVLATLDAFSTSRKGSPPLGPKEAESRRSGSLTPPRFSADYVSRGYSREYSRDTSGRDFSSRGGEDRFEEISLSPRTEVPRHRLR